MRYENIKSGILIILVLVSILLTWNLWTYQPNYDTMENSTPVKEVTVSEKQEVQSIVSPDQVLFHLKGKHYGTNNPVELDKMVKELRKWSFFDVKNVSDKVGNINDLARKDGNAEIIYAGEIPIELYRSVLNIEGKKVPSFNFNRIIIDVDNSEKDTGSVYFASSENQQVYLSRISTVNLGEFNHDFTKNATRYPEFFAFESSERKTIYLPEGKTEMATYKYLPVTVNSEEFKDALFNDPSYVQKSFVSHGEEYANASSKMTINYDTSMLQYINPIPEDNYLDSSYDLVKRSIDFVNEHGGWTGPYRYVSKREYNRSVTFRLYSADGFPVFNDRGLSEIYEEWGRDEIKKYVRSYIALNLPLTTEMQKVTQPSGHEILEFIKRKPNFKPELLEDLLLGYRMERDAEENKLILLEPTWFYRYDKTWGQITMDDLGGSKHGLE